MQLNIALLKAKLPYIIALFIAGMCAHYLFHGFLIRDIFICGALSIYPILNPNIFCWPIKAHEYDEYVFMDAFPLYLMLGGATAIVYIIANHIGYLSLDIITVISLSIFPMLFAGIIDRSRYD